MKVEKFDDLNIWREAILLSEKVYKVTSKFPKNEQFCLINQMRRSSISIPSNIAEGFERNGNKEFIQFLSIAKGSLGELRTQMIVSLKLRYLSQDEFNGLFNLSISIGKQISGFIKYLKKSTFKGNKYRI